MESEIIEIKYRCPHCLEFQEPIASPYYNHICTHCHREYFRNKLHVYRYIYDLTLSSVEKIE